MDMQEVIKAGLSLVQKDPQHDLRLGFRCQLMSLFDETNDREFANLAHRRRVKLATLAVEKVLPLWESFLPAERGPRHAMKLADELLAGTVAPAAAEKELGQFWTHCDDLMWKYQENQHVIMVGYGAVQVAREALSDTCFGRGKATNESTDLDVDPYSHDASFFAAAAYSLGAPWEPASDPQRRLEFWTWWLTSAAAEAANRA